MSCRLPYPHGLRLQRNKHRLLLHQRMARQSPHARVSPAGHTREVRCILINQCDDLLLRCGISTRIGRSPRTNDDVVSEASTVRCCAGVAVRYRDFVAASIARIGYVTCKGKVHGIVCARNGCIRWCREFWSGGVHNVHRLDNRSSVAEVIHGCPSSCDGPRTLAFLACSSV